MKNQDNNFKRALLKELTGFSYKDKESEEVTENLEQSDNFDFVPTQTERVVSSETEPTPARESISEPVKTQDETFTYRPTPKKVEISGTTTISRGTIINGGIQTRENIAIDGIVNGDILSKGKISVSGKVEGNLNGFDVDVSTEELIGDIVCESKVTIQAGTKIKGNIFATQAIIMGTVEGNIVSKESIQLVDNAVVYGDIKADSISVSQGAVIYGMVTIGKTKPDTSPF
ncbi:MAG: polymer-forming cytoskeletal protein [Oscillospiraceae bacterium]